MRTCIAAASTRWIGRALAWCVVVGGDESKTVATCNGGAAGQWTRVFSGLTLVDHAWIRCTYVGVTSGRAPRRERGGDTQRWWRRRGAGGPAPEPRHKRGLVGLLFCRQWQWLEECDGEAHSTPIYIQGQRSAHSPHLLTHCLPVSVSVHQLFMPSGARLAHSTRAQTSRWRALHRARAAAAAARLGTRGSPSA